MSIARRVAENPLLVLGLGAGASRIEIEREAQKLLGMIELGFAEALTYQTPLGPRARTAELVRASVAALRDPAQRLAAELWLTDGVTAASAPKIEAPRETWADARAILDWGPRPEARGPRPE
ncbi:MAG TPA: hypothetical protein VL463_14695 [Kofleriaceae bacterium]|nr:hypothetical protein [Kofleriaceae bacterium]